MADENTYTIDEQHPVSDSKGADEHADVAEIVVIEDETDDAVVKVEKAVVSNG